VTFVEALGKGGFGSVYLADVRGKDNFVQRIAVKVLNEELGDEKDLVARQRDEARILAQLNHDHIVKVFDLSEIHGRPAVFMEYVAGVDAGELLRKDPISPRAGLEISAAVASALHAAWATTSPVTGKPLHVVHRDIKPSNILLSEHGGVKVLDFGIARADFDREGQTRTYQFGTARYMAPEQWLGGTVGPAVDVYALGISLLELLCGEWTPRLSLRVDQFEQERDAAIERVRDPLWGAVWWRELFVLLQAMLSLSPDDRPRARDVQETLLDLSEKIGGESLKRMAQRRIPALMKQRRNQGAGVPLLGATDTWLRSEPDPSILTASKRSAPVDLHSESHALRLWDRHGVQWVAMVIGLLAAMTWMIAGWLGDQESSVQAAPVETEVRAPPDIPASPEVVTAGSEATSRDTEKPRDLPPDEVIIVRLESDPPGARVRVDGRRLGRTPLLEVELGVGKHRVRMRGALGTGTRSVEIRSGAPTRYTWHEAEDQWSAGY